MLRFMNIHSILTLYTSNEHSVFPEIQTYNQASQHLKNYVFVAELTLSRLKWYCANHKIEGREYCTLSWIMKKILAS